MSVTLPIGFDYGSGSGFVTHISPNVFMDNFTAYNASPGYGWTEMGGLNAQDKDAGIDARLASIVYVGAGAGLQEFRVDSGNGTFDVRLALGNAGSAHTGMKIRFFDGAGTTALLTVTGDTSDALHWLDATNVERTSAAAWVSNNASAPITITNGYVRFELGNSTGDYSTLSHVSFAAAGGGGGGGSKLLLRMMTEE